MRDDVVGEISLELKRGRGQGPSYLFCLGSSSKRAAAAGAGCRYKHKLNPPAKQKWLSTRHGVRVLKQSLVCCYSSFLFPLSSCPLVPLISPIALPWCTANLPFAGNLKRRGEERSIHEQVSRGSPSSTGTACYHHHQDEVHSLPASGCSASCSRSTRTSSSSSGRRSTSHDHSPRISDRSNAH